MAKRITDTEKWKDPWFCGLDAANKLFWAYLCDNCDHAGIWQVNWPLVKFHIPSLNYDPAVFNGRITVISKEKWFIKKFVLFQQKVNDLNELNPLNKCHFSIINILSKENLVSPLVAPKKGLGRGQGNSIGIGKGKGNSKEGIIKGRKFKKPAIDEVRSYCNERRNRVDPGAFVDFYESKGWMIGSNKMKSWQAAVRTWEKKAGFKPKEEPISTAKPFEGYDKESMAKVSNLVKETVKSMGVVK